MGSYKILVAIDTFKYVGSNLHKSASYVCTLFQAYSAVCGTDNFIGL
jgi:hypothetical protein